jgi:transposase
MPGISLLNALMIFAAFSDVMRVPSATDLVGYAGLGARVHSSGQVHQTGRITKAGRRDLRTAMVEAAQHAVRVHAHWQEVYAPSEVRTT